MKLSLCWTLTFVISCGLLISWSGVSATAQSGKKGHHSPKAQAKLASSGIGPGFRSKRDNKQASEHALNAKKDSLASAIESVAAAENSMAAGIEADEARKSLEEGDDDDDGDEDNEDDSDDENDLSQFLKNHKDGELYKLMTESSNLSKELRLVFDILAKREAQLVDEMDRLRSALTVAVDVLRPSSKTGKTSRIRRDYITHRESPYKACVYIEPSEEPPPPVPLESKLSYPPEPKITEFIPDEEPEEEENEITPSSNNNITTNTSDDGVNDIDLTKVYWVKLPSTMDEKSVHSKVTTVLSDVQGKDVLIIPISRGITSSREISEGFLKAVGVTPKTRKARFAKNKKLFHINVKEVK